VFVCVLFDVVRVGLAHHHTSIHITGARGTNAVYRRDKTIKTIIYRKFRIDGNLVIGAKEAQDGTR
jgi:hypothetical protein